MSSNPEQAALRSQQLAFLKEKVRRLSRAPGVYLMKDRFGCVIYVGKAKNLKKRISTYFQPSRKQRWDQPKINALLPLIFDFETIEVKSEPEALLLEGKLIKDFKPRYNTDFTDDKHFLLVRLDLRSAIPQFRLARVRADEESRYFGPFAHSALLRKTLAEMRRRFGVLLGDATPDKQPDGTWQLYRDARAEIYGHPNVVTQEQYADRVIKAEAFLEGKSREWLVDLRSEMQRASVAQEYERAAELRDVVIALEKTLAPTRKFTRSIPARSSHQPDTVHALGLALDLDKPPHVLECFDISHISGTFCVASMVRFRNGSPEKSQYRRYKIRSFIGNDDYRAMFEVVGRRYRRLLNEERPFPDLIVIDGGGGQVAAAQAAFAAHGITSPPLIGLAKQDERIIFSDGRAPLHLPRSDPALHVLQHIRDEAHRFANAFNADLRSRKIRESVLDDCPGLGSVRRGALFAHFRTLEAIRSASPDEIAMVPGIGPKFAHQIHAFLNRPAPPQTDL